MTVISRITAMILLPFSLQLQGADAITTQSVGMELGRDLASEVVLACRAKGYQVSAVVVDRHGHIRAAIRDDLAAHFTLEIAQRKANMTIMSGMDSGEFKAARSDIRPELNHINGLIVMDGGVAINAAGSRLGAIGVSGAPGGDIDTACAREGLEKFTERLEFMD